MILNAPYSPFDHIFTLSTRNRVFSGIQPSGVPHLGNYLGAIQNWVKLQNKHIQENLWCIVDLHAITVRQDPVLLKKQIRELAASLLACGIDPAAGQLFCQSAVSAHAELAWIFNCIARIGWLNRMTQFKDKVGKDRENASVGLYNYPILMAADILVYKACLVPVGEDQRQHIELANDIAQKFNHDYNIDFFPEVNALIPRTAARVMSLRDGTRKMSKSELSDQGRINLTDTADEIALKIKRARTDSEPLPSEIVGLEQRPEARNLIGIYVALSEKSVEEVLKNFGNQGFGIFKKELTALIVEKICPIGKKIRELLQNPQELDMILARGALEATALAEPVLREVKYLIGFTGFDITTER